MPTEAELPGVRVVRWRLGWPQLRRGLLVLTALLLLVLGIDELTDALEMRRLKREQSPQAQRAEWLRVHARGLAVAKLLKNSPARGAQEARQLLEGYWSDPQPLRTPAALQRAGNDSQDLIEASESLWQAERAEADQATLVLAAQQEDERWRQAEHGLVLKPLPVPPAAVRAATRVLPPSPYLSLRRLAWVEATSARRYRQQAQRAMWRLVYRYDSGA